MTESPKFIRVMGIPRSGNHPIIKHICRNAGPGGWVHYNLCRPGQDPTDAVTIETEDGLLKISSPVNAAAIAALPPLESRSVVIFSYEGLYLGAHHALENRISEPYEDRITHNVFITRSVQNWLASWIQQRLRKIKNDPDTEFNLETNPFFIVQKAITVFRNWLLHLKAVDAAIDAGGTSMTGNARSVGAVFDSFYTDADERARIVQELGLDVQATDLPGVTSYGGGSSFSGLKERDPAALQVEDRWRHFADNPYFALMLRVFWQDPEVRRLCQKHFPDGSAYLADYLRNLPAFDDAQPDLGRIAG